MEEVRGEGTLWSLPQVGRRRAAGGNAARKLTAVADSVRNVLPVGRAQARARELSPHFGGTCRVGVVGRVEVGSRVGHRDRRPAS